MPNIREKTLTWNKEVQAGIRAWDAFGIRCPEGVAENLMSDRYLGPREEIVTVLNESGISTPDGTLLGDSLQPLVMPWEALSNGLGDFDLFVAALNRRKNGGSTRDPYISERIIDGLRKGRGIYNNECGGPISAGRHLRARAHEDGPWGVVLTQWEHAGSTAEGPSSPVGGVCLYGMGAIEFAAASLVLPPLEGHGARVLPASRVGDLVTTGQHTPLHGMVISLDIPNARYHQPLLAVR